MDASSQSAMMLLLMMVLGAGVGAAGAIGGGKTVLTVRIVVPACSSDRE